MAFTCPRCFKTSHNPNDERERYCGNCHQFFSREIGRELKVSELNPRTVVWIAKLGRPFASMWVVAVSDKLVHFRAGKVGMEFFALRTGLNQEGITDDSYIPMKVFEYLGEV